MKGVGWRIYVLTTLFTMTSTSAEQLQYSPYGHKMCLRLGQRYGRISRYYHNSLSCLLEEEKNSSANKTCAQVIQSRNQQPICLQVVTDGSRSPQLYISGEASGRCIIQKQDLTNPHNVFQFPVGESCLISELICSQKKQKVFFIVWKKKNTRKASFTSMNTSGKQNRLLNIGIHAIAVDDVADFLFMTSTVFHKQRSKCRLQQFDLGRLKGGARTIHTFKNHIYGIEIDAKRKMIFCHSSLNIYFGNYEGNFLELYVGSSKISSIVYERGSRLLYFIQRRSLRSISVGDERAEFVRSMKDDQLPFKINKQLLFIPNRKRGELEAINVTSGIPKFNIPLPSGRIKFCIMN